ncbi:hypothetical protein HYQ44_009488 [Verticillium longisporum]|nr:hypothetical protein HYQ44_009488 [Verticillium longisporum]
MLLRFGRKFDWAHDYIYTPINIEKTGSMWLLLDINKDLHPKTTSQDVDLAVFKVRLVGDVLHYDRASYNDANGAQQRSQGGVVVQWLILMASS